ncbi:putative Response regulator receiver protein [Desulfosarcina cetonica]|uniref:ATP-binding response regulator n=1 Tax=Desulfosarcina cetonica TaxID=90730 RepID=UPI0006CF2387|nr:response regulator [Desulfosarcina cetonica]VTR66331.1 putative Response regulator receiver protein [Desulfosarcina cetonica]
MLNPQAKKKILVVDDLLTNRKIVEHMLEKGGYQTMSAASGMECIQMATSRQIDLILLDIMMPDMDGIEVCKRLRKDSRTGAMPVIFVTSATDDGTLSRAFDAGGNDYIRKPVNRVELIKRVQAAFVHEALAQKNKEEEKLRSVLSMSGTICHEINQPLQYISGISQLLLMDLEKGSKAYEKIAKMKVQIDRMGEITKRLMQISRVDAVSYIGETKILSLGN